MYVALHVKCHFRLKLSYFTECLNSAVHNYCVWVNKMMVYLHILLVKSANFPVMIHIPMMLWHVMYTRGSHVAHKVIGGVLFGFYLSGVTKAAHL